MDIEASRNRTMIEAGFDVRTITMGISFRCISRISKRGSEKVYHKLWTDFDVEDRIIAELGIPNC